MENIKVKIIILRDKLKIRGNSSAEFFDKLLFQLEADYAEALLSIQRSYSIVQYGNFDSLEEDLFDEIWSAANKMLKKE